MCSALFHQLLPVRPLRFAPFTLISCLAYPVSLIPVPHLVSATDGVLISGSIATISLVFWGFQWKALQESRRYFRVLHRAEASAVRSQRERDRADQERQAAERAREHEEEMREQVERERSAAARALAGMRRLEQEQLRAQQAHARRAQEKRARKKQRYKRGEKLEPLVEGGLDEAASESGGVTGDSSGSPAHPSGIITAPEGAGSDTCVHGGENGESTARRVKAASSRNRKAARR
mmetsp:Transcript_34900/g.79820  ORF Transcript_34900/g.79820 Transcript_34900/m.79820 type:complete len:235 (+) Transcript_34900:488-1192(+)